VVTNRRAGVAVVGLGLLAGLLAPVPALARSIAFYSGDRLPLEALSWFQEVVLEPSRVSDPELTALRRGGTLSVARITPADVAAGAPAALALLTKLQQRGFTAFLFDARDPARVAATEGLLREARRRNPSAQLYYWGNLERLSAVAQVISGFVTDGIFTERLPRAGETTAAPAVLDDIEGVRRLANLVRVRGSSNLPFIVLERMPAGQREQARGIARTLAERGFIPWVTVGGHSLGVGLREYVPRRVLVLYDGQEEAHLPETVAHRLLAVPLEYLGYAVDYVDVRNARLPQGDLTARYAGIASWYSDDDMPQPRAYEGWLLTQINSGLRVAMFGKPGLPPSSGLLARMGLVESNRPVVGPVSIAGTSVVMGFEATPSPLARDLPNWQAREGEVHIELRDSRGQRLTPVITGSWGGMALEPYVLDSGLEQRIRWIVDPFAFLTRALDLEPIPAPDPTTESGRRLLFIHIDGDSFNSRAEMPGRAYGGEVILKDFLQRYTLPHTVSIIEGEVGPEGKFKEESPKLEVIARQIFKLPHVEVASHSYSHPFDWVRASKGETTRASESSAAVNMDIPGYRYNAHREVAGSIAYINDRLAPKDKPARVFLWSGDALPGADALREVTALKLANMNGFNAENPREIPTLSQVPSYGRYVDGMLHVYAQAHNENVYTSEWTTRFYGFRDVIDGFRFSEAPRRLKPINIYYHFYLGTKPAGITSLHEVYKYALEQETLPIYVSEMVSKVEDFHRVTFARRIDGAWELRGLGSLRTVRLDRRLGWPDLNNSVGVAGVADTGPGRYVAFGAEPEVTLALTSARPVLPHLVSSNAQVVSWTRDKTRVNFRLKGHMPVNVTIGGCTSAEGVAGASRVRVDPARQTVRLSFPTNDTREVSLPCR
jgi:polysaccharide biosynthesis protein PelA